MRDVYNVPFEHAEGEILCLLQLCRRMRYLKCPLRICRHACPILICRCVDVECTDCCHIPLRGLNNVQRKIPSVEMCCCTE